MKSLFIVCMIGLLMFPESMALYARKRVKSVKKEVEIKDSAYDKLFQGQHKESLKGMFTIHKMDGKVYFEIPLDLLGRDMLLGSTVSEINDNGDALVGQKPIKPLYVKFVRHDSTIQLQRVTALNVVVDSKWEGVERAIKINTIPTIFQTFNIEAYTPDKSAVVVDVTSLFITDIKLLQPFDPYGTNMFFGFMSRTSVFQKEQACLNEIKAFEDNVSVKSTLTYISDYKLLGLFTFMKDKPTTAKMVRTFLLLPKQPIRPRIADPRIGVFVSGNEYFTPRNDQAEAIYFANRWNLEPVDVTAYKRGELVEPKKPIVFYVDNNFPIEWREAIKQGIIDWNIAFEKIGFKNAVQAVDFPVDDPEFDPDNLKYSCVRYAPTWVANAMGPSWKDPRSGEIVCASVYLHHNILKILNNWRFVQTAQIDSAVRARVLPDEQRNEAIRYVVAHEIGHCLGLMHNMGASAAYPVDSLRSVSFTQKYGTTPSIMDYARFNYVAQPEDKGVKLTPPQLGAYDYYVIKWLYTPMYVSSEEEKVILDKWISEKAGDPVYRYGKQQIFARYDPSSLEEDLGDDPIKAGAYGVQNLKYIMKNLNLWLANDDPDYSHREALYGQLLGQYKRYLRNVMVNIGGLYLYEKKVGDPYTTYKAVPKEIQRKSLKFIIDQLKDMKWLEDEELLKNMSLKQDGVKETQVGKYSMFKGLLSKKNAVLLSSERSDDPYTLKEYLDDIYREIWGNTMTGKTLTSAERAFQIDFIDMVVSNIDPSVKTGTIFFTDPEAVRQGKLNIWDRVYATTLDDVVLYNLDESGMAVKLESSIRELASSLDNSYNFDINGFGWIREVKTEEVYDTKGLYYNYLLKIKSLFEKNQNIKSPETQNHYKHMLFKVRKILNSDITTSSK